MGCIHVIALWHSVTVFVFKQLIWLVVFFSTVLLGVDIGLGVGVVFSLLVLNIRTIL